MPFFDFPIDQLRKYRAPDEREPSDFDRFWANTLKEARQFDLDVQITPVKHPAYQQVQAYDLSYRGYAGQPIRAWLILPKLDKPKPLPCLITYHGYGGGRAFPIDNLPIAVAGFANLVMDTRGQGSTWSPGHTADLGPSDGQGGNPQFPGFMTRGIDSPQHYYYRRVFTDAVRAIEVAQSLPQIDPKRIGLTGGSQGGAITIAAAALCPKPIKIAMPDVPFLCNFRRAITIIDTSPYNEVAQYLKCHRDKKEQVFQTLSYFDGVHFASRIKARCLFSVGLMDTICPPSTVFAAYNRVKAPKDIRVYDFNNHEGGASFQMLEKLAFAHQYL